jgi:hypothetical protein
MASEVLVETPIATLWFADSRPARYVRDGPPRPASRSSYQRPLLLDESRDVSFCDYHLVGLKWAPADRNVEPRIARSIRRDTR